MNIYETYKPKKHVDPCPFCGSEESVEIMMLEYPGERKVVCNFSKGGCGASGGVGDGEREALDRWNKRDYTPEVKF